MTQPEFDLGLPSNPVGRHRGEGETGGTRERKEVDPSAVAWRRVHTTEKCHACIAEQALHLVGGESIHAAWPASYIRTEGSSRLALCFEHAAPIRHREGLLPQRSSDPNNPINRKRKDSYE